MQLFLVAALIIAIVAVIFALQNPAAVTVSFLVWQTQGSLALVLLITLLFGVLISLLVSVPTVIRRSRTISIQRKQIQSLEGTLAEREQQLQELTANAATPQPIGVPSTSSSESFAPLPPAPPDIPPGESV
jgi:putative membrane protein